MIIGGSDEKTLFEPEGCTSIFAVSFMCRINLSTCIRRCMSVEFLKPGSLARLNIFDNER